MQINTMGTAVLCKHGIIMLNKIEFIKLDCNTIGFYYTIDQQTEVDFIDEVAARQNYEMLCERLGFEIRA